MARLRKLVLTNGVPGDAADDGDVLTIDGMVAWSAGFGVGLTWTDAFSTATLNSIASTNGILSDLAISNGTALDRYMDISFALASAAFTGTGINISIHLY